MIQNYKITHFGIKNFRSFDAEGIYIDKLSKVNLFIGKNNSGKSNILKFLKILAGLNGAWSSFPGSESEKHKDSDLNSAIVIKCSHQELGFPNDYEIALGTSPGRRVSLDYAINKLMTIEFPFKQNVLFLKGLKPRGQNGDDYIAYEDADVMIAIINKLGIRMAQGHADYWHEIERHFYDIFIRKLHEFISKIVYIPDFREITMGDKKVVNSNALITGNNIIAEINKMKNPDQGEHKNREKFDKIEKIVKELLDVQQLSIEIPYTADKIILNIDGNRYGLENFGTGIHEIVLLCSSLIVHENSIICIEEPEIHLHPELQRKFINFLYSTSNQYLITTHSNVFLDYAKEDLSVYHLEHDGRKSKLSRCFTNNDTRRIIDDLGYKTSDLLQSNGIIWVEGPSDRIYLKKWLELYGCTLKEGINYSIMFYGGKLLSHLTYDDGVNDDAEYALIQMLRINKNAYVVIDKDKKTPEEINNTKQRICKEIGENNFWVTAGIEVENYLTLNTINSWIKSRNSENYIVNLTKDSKFDTVVKQAIPSIKYASKKYAYSGEIAKFIQKGDLENLDLVDKMKELTNHITKWNR